MPERDLEELDDVALCEAWIRSFAAFKQPLSVTERARVVGLRRSYLDELERRDAVALTAWLHSGARADGSPAAYFRGRMGPPETGPPAGV